MTQGSLKVPHCGSNCVRFVQVLTRSPLLTHTPLTPLSHPSYAHIHNTHQAIQAGQVTVEDHLMSDLAIQPLLVVGWEGLIGSLVMFGGALPLLQVLPYRDGSGFAEDTVGSWCMIRNSPAIAGAGSY